mmetsp:Transcript_90420/g.234473  ORF Transcript_90420/g.234473 Transcript_90420/m.234473 type:complete len:214 (+) Transcript_90420:2467-3108(+)
MVADASDTRGGLPSSPSTVNSTRGSFGLSSGSISGLLASDSSASSEDSWLKLDPESKADCGPNSVRCSPRENTPILCVQSLAPTVIAPPASLSGEAVIASVATESARKPAASHLSTSEASNEAWLPAPAGAAARALAVARSGGRGCGCGAPCAGRRSTATRKGWKKAAKNPRRRKRSSGSSSEGPRGSKWRQVLSCVGPMPPLCCSSAFLKAP